MSVLSHLKLPEHQYTPQVPMIDTGVISSTAESISRQHEAAKEGWNNIENKLVELSQNANPYERDVLNKNFANVSLDIQQAVEEGRYREIADKLPTIHRNLIRDSLPVIDSIKKREQALNLIQNSTHIPEQYRGKMMEDIQNHQGLFNKPLSLPNKWLGAVDYVNFTKTVVPDSIQEIDEEGGVKTSTRSLTREEITTRLLPIATMPGSEFMRQEMFVADMETSKEGVINTYLNGEPVRYDLSNPEDRRKYVQFEAAKRVQSNLFDASAATSFNQEGVQQLSGRRTGTRNPRSGAIEDRMKIENYLNITSKLPISSEVHEGYKQGGMSYQEWLNSDFKVDEQAATSITKDIDDHLINYGYTIGDDGFSVYANGKIVSSEEDPVIYNLLEQRALLDQKRSGGLREIEKINSVAFNTTLSKMGLTTNDVALGSDGEIIWKKKDVAKDQAASNIPAIFNPYGPSILYTPTGVEKQAFISEFNKNRDIYTRQITSRAPTEFNGYIFSETDGDGSISVGRVNVESALTNALYTNSAEFKLRLRDSDELVSFKDGSLYIGNKKYDDYKDVKFEATHFSLSAENGRPVVVGRFVHGKDKVPIQELVSVSARGTVVDSSIAAIVGQEDFSRVQLAHQIVGSIQSAIPRFVGGTTVIDSNFLNSFGINSVANPNYDEYDAQSMEQIHGIIDNVEVKNKGGTYEFTIKYANPDIPSKRVVKASTIDFLKELPNLLQQGYEAEQKLESGISQAVTSTFTSDNPSVNFVVQQEGFFEQPYVPTANNRVIGNSGVTIGAGIDLGQQSADSLKSFGFNDNFIAKVEPYIGLRRSDATDSLRRSPLRFNANEIQQIREATPRVIQSYAASASRVIGVDYARLPEAAQSVIASVAYHKGPNFFAGRNGQALGRAIKSGDYATAGRILRTLGNQEPVFRNRRNQEAALIESLSRNRA